MKKDTPIYAGSHVVGSVRGDTFYKSVRPAHQLKQPPAWALDVESLRDAERAGAVRVELRDRETRVIWRATIATIRKLGQPIDRGFGAQIALPLAYWSASRPGDASAADQMSLL